MYPITFTLAINIIQTTQVLLEAKYVGRHKLPTLTAFDRPDKTDTTFRATVQLLQNQIS